MLELLINNQPIATAEVTEWQEVEFTCIPPPGCTLALAPGGIVTAPALQPFLRPGDPRWCWRWNTQNRVGTVRLVLRVTRPDTSTEEHCFTLHVRPRKLDQQRYEAMLNDLQRMIPALVYAFDGTLAGQTLNTAGPDNPASPPPHPLEAYFRFFDERFEPFERAVQAIIRHPHTTPLPLPTRLPTERAYDVSGIGFDLARGPHYRVNNTLLPADITHPGTRTSVDTYENRLLKRLLDELWHRARTLAEHTTSIPPPASARKRESLTALVEHLRTITHRLHQLRSLPLFAQVGQLTAFHGATHTLRHNAAYRQVYRVWQDMQRLPQVAVESPLFHIPVNDVPFLYECWCVVQILSALLRLPGVTVLHQRGIAHDTTTRETTTASPCLFTLVQHTPMLVAQWHNATLCMRYQPRYTPLDKTDEILGSLDSHVHIPDSAIEITIAGCTPRVVVFDAKYQLTTSSGIPPDALADAYTYLGCIGVATGKQTTHSSVLLYPGNTMESFASGVRIVPLVPGSTAPFEDMLQSLILSLYPKKTML